MNRFCIAALTSILLTHSVAEASSEWNWTPIDNTICRDGSSTGVGISLGTNSNLLIFMAGGGKCVDAESCAANPSSFNETDLKGFAYSYLTQGIFDRSD